MSTINPAAEPKSTFGKIFHNLEENFLALCMALMTAITFANVVARYVFNSNILWALELTVYLFAWLVLMGVSYGVKMHFHIGIDILLNAVPQKTKKLLGLTSVGLAIFYVTLLFIGALSYWLPFAGLEEWLIGVENASDQAFYEVEDIPMLPFLNFLSDMINEGEAYEKLPRFIPYAVLPLGMALLLFRLLEQAWYIYTDKVGTLVAGHEVEEPANLRSELLEEADSITNADNTKGSKS